jgi:hypothetical protein
MHTTRCSLAFGLFSILRFQLPSLTNFIRRSQESSKAQDALYRLGIGEDECWESKESEL